MRNAQLGALFDAGRRRQDEPGLHRIDIGVHHDSSRQPSARVGPGAESRIPTTVVAEIQAWLARKPESERGAECWQQIPGLLEAAIERVIASTELQHADKADLRQKIWLRIVRHFKDLEADASIETLIAWAVSIAENEVKRESNRRKHRPRRDQTNEDEALLATLQDLDPDDEDREELQALVRRVIAEIEAREDPIDAEILRLHDLDGVPLNTLAPGLGLTENQVYKRHQRALGLFRRAMESRNRAMGEPWPLSCMNNRQKKERREKSLRAPGDCRIPAPL